MTIPSNDQYLIHGKTAPAYIFEDSVWVREGDKKRFIDDIAKGVWVGESDRSEVVSFPKRACVFVKKGDSFMKLENPSKFKA